MSAKDDVANSVGLNNLMTNSKLQAAVDEVERLFDTVKEFQKRNGQLPNPDSDAGRAFSSLQAFLGELKRFNFTQFRDLAL
jgi:hypothetical protein